MAGRSLTKDLHRMMKRVGRLTDGQASIDKVDWDQGSLNSFGVTIRPNAGCFKDGRFKFTVYIPDGYIDGKAPIVYCETEIHHPNIDAPTVEEDDEPRSNICLSLFEEGVWNPAHGLESIVIGILFLMHNPNWYDALRDDMSGYSHDDREQYEADVKEYMATGRVDDLDLDYNIDFRVIDGKFVEMPTDKNNDNCEESETDNLVETNNENKNKIDNESTQSNITSDISGDKPSGNSMILSIIDYNDDIEEDVRPVEFIVDGEADDGSFFLTFKEDNVKSEDTEMECCTHDFVSANDKTTVNNLECSIQCLNERNIKENTDSSSVVTGDTAMCVNEAKCQLVTSISMENATGECRNSFEAENNITFPGNTDTYYKKQPELKDGVSAMDDQDMDCSENDLNSIQIENKACNDTTAMINFGNKTFTSVTRLGLLSRTQSTNFSAVNDAILSTYLSRSASLPTNLYFKNSFTSFTYEVAL